MADGEVGVLTAPGTNVTADWSGGNGTIYVTVDSDTWDASDYIYGPLRATYTINHEGAIVTATCNGTGQWGTGIAWNSTVQGWQAA